MSKNQDPPDNPPDDPASNVVPIKGKKPRKRKAKPAEPHDDAYAPPAAPKSPDATPAPPRGLRAPPPAAASGPPTSTAPQGQALPAIISGNQPLHMKKMEQFCREYIIDLNATQAAIRSGYSAKTARVIGPQNLSKLAIRQRIECLLREATVRVANKEELEASADKTMAHLQSIAYSNALDLLNLDAIPDGSLMAPLKGLSAHKARGIQKIKIKEAQPIMSIIGGELVPREVLEVEITMWNKNDALEKLMKVQGLLKDQPAQINIQFIDQVITNIRNQIIALGGDPEILLKQLEKDLAVINLPALPGDAGKPN